MKYFYLIFRIIFGIGLLVFGLNKFFNFLPMPEFTTEAANFFRALSTYGGGYIIKIVGIVEIVSALLIIAGKYVPLATILLFPVILNAFLFHLFLDIGNIMPAALFLLFNIYLFFKHADHFDEILDD